MPDLELERRYASHGVVVGVDEAGRGPLAGPVSVGAAILPEGFTHDLINDSKKLSEKKRELLYEEIAADSSIQWSVVLVEPEEIDEVNILRATHLGMERAVSALGVKPGICLIDGLPLPRFPYPHEGIVKGDSKSLSIATASIFAKVTRDRVMREAAKKYPGYGFEKHKGYGTKAHLEALRTLGPCPIHRRSFQPVAQLTLPLG
ncbi:MAG: ribonuclease HII [Akkermansiaceae bacterium]|jgi:ribonuclease HII